MSAKQYGYIKDSEGRPVWGVLGGSWKLNIFKKKSKGRQETGRSKGIKPSSLLKWMCSRNRSYKHPLYEATMAKAGVRGKKGI